MRVTWKPWTSGVASAMAVMATFTVLVIFSTNARGHAAAAQGPPGGAPGTPPGASAAYQFPAASPADLQLLRGAIEIHVHAEPEGDVNFNTRTNNRANDADDVARQAKALGMRGIVVKQHFDQTASLAYQLRKEVPGLEVFGILTSNFSMGGLNPSAVEYFTNVKGGWGRIVMMPTVDGEYNVGIGFRKENRQKASVTRGFVPITKDGELLPVVKEVISQIAKLRTRDSNGELVLATGHSSPAEVLLLLREGQKQGLKHMYVIHPLRGPSTPPNMTAAQLQEAAKLGAFIEFTAGGQMTATPVHPWPEDAEILRKVGVDHALLSTDLPGNSKMLEGLAAFAGMLRKQGFTDHELARMMQENPARLLGLPIQASTQSRREN